MINSFVSSLLDLRPFLRKEYLNPKSKDGIGLVTNFQFLLSSLNQFLQPPLVEQEWQHSVFLICHNTECCLYLPHIIGLDEKRL